VGRPTRSPGRLALRAFPFFHQHTAPLEFHACGIAVFGSNFPSRMAVEVDACRALCHQGTQVGRPGGVALQEE
jgi:hypothetical protein